jgi:fatty-acyl-CoA synthase
MEGYVPSLFQLLRHGAKRSPDRTALVHGPTRIGYGSLLDYVLSLTSALRERGIGPGQCVAVLLGTGVELIITILATARLGGVYVPLNPGFSQQELELIVARTKPKALVINGAIGRIADAVPKLPTEPDTVIIDIGAQRDALVSASYVDFDSFIASGRPHADDEAERAEASSIFDDFAIVYTSGTTGTARGVVVNQFSGVATGHGIARALRLDESDVLLSLIPPISYINLCCSIPASFSVGGTLVLPDYPTPIVDAIDLMINERVSFVHGVPTHYIRLLAQEDRDPSIIRELSLTGLVSGAECPPDVIRRVREEYNIALCNHYGLAECGGVSAVTIDERLDEIIYHSVGTPFEWVRVKTTSPLNSGANGSVGEVLVQSPGLMNAYHADHEATLKKFTEDGWLRTGDLGCLSSSGHLQLVGRASDVIIRGGNNVYPGEVESVLRSHPSVVDAVVFSIPDNDLGDAICACLLYRTGAESDIPTIFRYLTDKLARFKIPDYLGVVDEVPTNVAGKALRRELRRRVQDGEIAITSEGRLESGS